MADQASAAPTCGVHESGPDSIQVRARRGSGSSARSACEASTQRARVCGAVAAAVAPFASSFGANLWSWASVTASNAGRPPAPSPWSTPIGHGRRSRSRASLASMSGGASAAPAAPVCSISNPRRSRSCSVHWTMRRQASFRRVKDGSYGANIGSRRWTERSRPRRIRRSTAPMPARPRLDSDESKAERQLGSQVLGAMEQGERSDVSEQNCRSRLSHQN